MIATTLHHYRITGVLGSGGMGEVYAAEDTKLHRRVALKLLPPDAAADAERLQRFQREAQAVAALNHPNIVTIYSVEEAAGVHFLTMELVEGKTLVDVISPSGLPLPRFLELALPLVDAVGAAHQRGIVHRDLKPANIMVSSNGRLKVLDFGLAKLKQEPGGPGDSVVTTAQLTEQHRVIGTAAYMSPEQAEGGAVDHRSDVFSLGIVLYEVACGRRPFRGDTAVSVMSSILKDTPRTPTEVNPRLPRALDRVISRCLAKDPTRRYQSVRDLGHDLEDLQPHTPPLVSLARWNRSWLVGSAAAVIALILVVSYLWLRHGRVVPIRATFSQLTAQPGAELFPSLSPDGKWVVYAADGTGNRDIYLQSVSGQTLFNLTKDSAADDDEPAFSPDGERIAFRSGRDGGGLFVMGRTGEAVRKITSMGFNPAWSPDGANLVFATGRMELNPQNSVGRSELRVVSVNGGETRRIGDVVAVQPSWSPHNQRIAFQRMSGPNSQMDIWTVPVSGGPMVAVMNDAATDWNPVWSRDGRYLYFSSDRGGNMNLWRVPIDEQSGTTRGEPEALTTPAPFLAHPSISADGRHIAYSAVLRSANIQQLAFDPSTGAVKGDPSWLTTGSRSFSSPDPSPDGEWVVFYSTVQPEGDLYVVRADGTGLRPVTTDVAIDRVPRWSPDGTWIVCFSNRNGTLQLWKVRPDGSELQQLTDAGSYAAWSPDGSRLAVTVAREGHGFIVNPNQPWKQQKPEPLPPFEVPRAQFLLNSWSPDGNRLVGQAGEPSTGIVTYTLGTRTYERLTDFGEWPVWLPDSRNVLFVAGGKAFYIVDSRTKQIRKIFSVERDVLGPPRLTRDGRKAYYSRRVTEADLWLMTLQ